MLHIMGREERKRETKVRGKACKEIRCVKRRAKRSQIHVIKAIHRRGYMLGQGMCS
jgi:hypothetical protein